MDSRDDFYFRKMQEDDLPGVAAMEQEAQVCPWSNGQLRDCFEAGYDCWVCSGKSGEDSVGQLLRAYAVVSTVLNEASLLNFCVAPTSQGKGIGRGLLAFLLERLESEGIDTVFLEVRVSNRRAIGFYEAAGFRQISRRKAYYSSPQGREDALIYSRLSSGS